MPQEKRQNFSRRLLAILMPFWKTAALVIVLTLLTAGIHAIEPLVQKQIFDALAGQVSIFQDMTSLKFIGLAVLALVSLVLLSEAVTFTATYLSWKLRLKTNYKLLDAVVSRIYQLSLSYHQRETIASLRTRIDRGINGFCSVLFDISFSILPSVLYLACTIVFMFMLSWKLSLVALFFAPLPAIIGIFAGKIASEREKVLMKRWIEIFSRFHETLSLIKVVKSFAREDAERNKFLGEVEQANQIVARGVAVDSMLGSGKNISMAFGRIAVLGFGSYLIMQGEITIGTLVAFLSYVGGLAMPVIGLAGVYEAYRKARVYIEMIFEVIDTPEDVQDRSDAVEMPKPAGSVSFENVSFAYRADRPILQDVSFSVPAGAMVALVGPSGSGKSTIVDLLNRYYDVGGGSIKIDGEDIRAFKQRSLRAHIGMVLQDTALLNDTIAANIAFARPDASQAEIEAAAKAANADSFIAKLPDGYATEVGERGSCLSGGERQRVAIARAILKDAPILVFDEASSNLDSESEALVQQSIAWLSKRKTLFVIAHRLSTIKRADVILVVENGRIVERGTHVELIERGGLYCRLVAMQNISSH